MCSKSFIYYYPSMPVSFYIYEVTLSQSPQYSPNGCSLCMLKVLFSTIPSHLMQGTQFNRIGGVKCMARGKNLL